MKNKAISPFMATVLLVAFTLAIAALIGGWLTSLRKRTTTVVEDENFDEELFNFLDRVCQEVCKNHNMSYNHCSIYYNDCVCTKEYCKNDDCWIEIERISIHPIYETGE